MATLAVLGLGNMGSALAHCLLKAGYSVCVWNRTPEKTKSFANAGAVICVSPEDAVAASDFVIVCIKSHKETAELVSGLSVSLEGKTICDMSTGDTSDADSLVSFLSEKNAGYMLGMINAQSAFDSECKLLGESCKIMRKRRAKLWASTLEFHE